MSDGEGAVAGDPETFTRFRERHRDDGTRRIGDVAVATTAVARRGPARPGRAPREVDCAAVDRARFEAVSEDTAHGGPRTTG
ncbi:hypothetical protein ACQEU5_08335 [Marinactinospora thermotolerans]|uniref:Uncharacterized protein n=1 Tax=Marinactinospora thermotolerans DSM 45154 TaxID=1122192 RepID=A0A1T4RB02_9ACTN|nr:hypothetical protein [Marinactinospora thermotolerans]SKA13214.1 hypothetical protein SAMN02745673_02671 [Marinactinospora thermotolerans DSM 45154]